MMAEHVDKLIISGAGFVIASLIAVAAFFIRKYLTNTEDQVTAAASANAAVLKEIRALRSATANAVNGLRAEIQATDRRWSEQAIRDDARFADLVQKIGHYSKDVSKLEGRIEEHMDLLANQISMNRAINDKLTSLFKYIDAKARATDISEKT